MPQLIPEADFPLAFLKPGQHSQQGTFAGAGRAKQHSHAAGGKLCLYLQTALPHLPGQGKCQTQGITPTFCLRCQRNRAHNIITDITSSTPASRWALA